MLTNIKAEQSSWTNAIWGIGNLFIGATWLIDPLFSFRKHFSGIGNLTDMNSRVSVSDVVQFDPKLRIKRERNRGSDCKPPCTRKPVSNPNPNETRMRIVRGRYDRDGDY